jgi:hypothetical protein
MILYTNGDSFVAGCGLADYLLPEYPGDCGTTADLEMDRKFTDEWNQKKKQLWSSCTTKTLYRIIQLERIKAFPAKLKTMFNCELVDSSEGGSSFDKITRKSIVDLIKIRKSTSERVVAIIGDTVLRRRDQPYITQNGKPDWFPFQYNGGHPQPNISCPPMLEVIYNQSMFTEHRYHTLYYYYKNCILLKEFCKNHNIELHWLRVIDSNDTDLECYDDLTVLREHADIKHSVNMIQESASVQLCFVRDGHFSESVHDRVTQSFYSIISGNTYE